VDVPDCQDCGACCHAPNPGHVPLTGEDHARLRPSEQRDLVVFRGSRCFMRLDDGRCVNLVEEDGRFACGVYARRPAICRELERGDPGCGYARLLVYGDSDPTSTR